MQKFKNKLYLCFMRNKKQSNAGRPEKFGEPTTTIAIRVPISKKDHYKKVFTLFVDSKEIKQVSELNEIIIQ